MRVRKQRDAGLAAVLERVSAAKLARLFGITPQAISKWERVPGDRIYQVSKVTGIPVEQLRPDLCTLKHEEPDHAEAAA